MSSSSAVVIGAGIIGLAVARELQRTRDMDVTVLEKEHDIALHQSGRNSGVVHAGLYYPPGSLKAVLCRRGMSLLEEFCAEHGIAYERCGKLLIALDEAEVARLSDIEQRARANAVPELSRVGPSGVRDIEPHAVGLAGLHSPATSIVDFRGVCVALAKEILRDGGHVHTSSGVTGITVEGRRVSVESGERRWTSDLVINCAGLHSDRVAQLGGGAATPRIVPFKGSYFRLRDSARPLVRGLIYPVPDPRYPFLGVHLTKRWDGEVLVGPNAVLAFGRERYGRTPIDWSELMGLVRDRGFRRFARANWRTGGREAALSVSRRSFAAAARRYVPALRVDDLVPGHSGIRAQAMDSDGSLVDDFRIERLGNVVHLRNAPSPGATSSLAIAEHLVAMVT